MKVNSKTISLMDGVSPNIISDNGGKDSMMDTGSTNNSHNSTNKWSPSIMKVTSKTDFTQVLECWLNPSTFLSNKLLKFINKMESLITWIHKFNMEWISSKNIKLNKSTLDSFLMGFDMDLVDFLLKKWNLVDNFHIIYIMV